MHTILFNFTRTLITVFLLSGLGNTLNLSIPENSGNTGDPVIQASTPYPDPAHTNTPIPTYTSYPIIGGEETAVPTVTLSLETVTSVPTITGTLATQVPTEPPGTVVATITPGADNHQALPESDSEIIISTFPTSPPNPSSGTGTDSTTIDEIHGTEQVDASDNIDKYLEISLLVFGISSLSLGVAMTIHYFRSKQ